MNRRSLRVAAFLLLALAVTGVIASVAIPPVTAVNGGVVVSPPFQEVVLKQEAEQTQLSVELTNQTTTALEVRLSAADFKSLDDSGGVAFLGQKEEGLWEQYRLAQWIKLPVQTFVLAPGDKKQVLVGITNAATLSPGGHYAAVLFHLQAAPSALPSQVAIDQTLASLFFVKKLGGESYALELSQAVDNGKLFALPSNVELRFHNSGNVHATPRGLVTIRDPLRRTVAQGTINEASALVLPESDRRLGVPLRKLSSAFLPGRYTLEVLYRFDGKEDFETLTTKRLIIPPGPPLALGALLVLGYLGKRAIRRKKR